ncbi:MAG: hypothetical protein IJZ72_09975, partial [Oscillospiraceae bacterium]|nr:hypothetical protein [Oscillospiraceae bacterium]
MRIMNNISAMNAHRLYTSNNSKLSKSLEKLSSGYAINRAGDNAAGLAVSEKMRAQIAGLEQASKNAQDGISMVQTYEGALTESDSILQRMRSLAVQSANGTYDNSVDRVAIEQEFKQLNDELNQIADTDFNGVIVLNGGIMADGTKATGQNIDYTAGVKEPKELTQDDVVLGDAAYAGTNDETVTFTATKDKSGNVTWKASAGALQSATDLKEGGFSYDGAVFAFDTDQVNTGDYITVEFTKNTAAVAGKAPAALGYSNNNDKAASSLATAVTAKTGATPASETARDEINALQGAKISYETDDEGVVTKATLTLEDGTTVNSTDNATADAKSKYGIAVNDGAITVSRWDADATTPASADVLSIAKGTNIAKTDAANQSGELTIAFSDAKFANKVTGDIKINALQVSKSNANNASTAKLTYADGMTLQVGSRTKDLVDFTFKYDADSIGELEADLDCSARGLGTDKLSLATQEDANVAIDKIDHAINKVSMVRGTFGSIQNRLEHKISNLDTNTENLTAAESRIRDTDMAAEMMEFTKNQILSQASQSMLAQANQLPQGVLSLL